MAGPTDKEFEASIARMLRAGIVLSAAIAIVGGFLYLRHPFMAKPDYSHFHLSASSPRTVPSILQGVAHLDAASIMQLGLLVLIATPVVRVALCIVGFARQRDGIYIAVSISVFVILLYSLIHGGR